MNPPKVFVTGATGFVGRAVVARLRLAGCPVCILARQPGSAPVRDLVSRFGVEVRQGDVTAPESLPAAMTGAQAIVHLVGIISEVRRVTFERLHTEATRNVVHAAQTTGIRRLVHMSALGTRPNAASRYHQTKWAAEEIVRHSGLDWTIFRPSLIYGPEDHLVNLFATLIRRLPVVPVLGGEQTRFQPVAVERVAEAFAGALTRKEAVGQTFDLCGPERMTRRELLEQVMAAMGRRRLLVRVPAPLACLQAATLEFLFPRLLGKAPPLNRDQLIMLGEDNTGDAAKADALFGLQHRKFRDGLAAYTSIP
jgi:NADH dehydrogenase